MGSLFILYKYIYIEYFNTLRSRRRRYDVGTQSKHYNNTCNNCVRFALTLYSLIMPLVPTHIIFYASLDVPCDIQPYYNIIINNTYRKTKKNISFIATAL